MKKLTIIVHADIKQSLADVLRAMPEVAGFTFTAVEGHGPQDESDIMFSARDRVVGYTPHVRVDMVLNDADIDKVLEAMRGNNCGVTGRGIYWVTPVDRIDKL
ncbi:MAG: DUF3240 family protein [Nitrospirota bacterium]